MTPLLAALGFVATVLTKTVLQGYEKTVYVAAALIAIIAVTVDITGALSPNAKRLLNELSICVVVLLAVFVVPPVLLVRDFHSSLRRIEDTVTTPLQDIRSTVDRVERKVTIPSPPIPIQIRNFPLGGLYNASYDNQVGGQLASGVPLSRVNIPPPGYTHVFERDDRGIDWVLQGSEASFSYDRHNVGLQSTLYSSGGYTSFPDVVVNRLVYEYLRFDCKVSNSEGRPDLGIRLAVDDLSQSSADKEVAAYELPSLNQQFRAKPLAGEWQNYEIHVPGLVERVKQGRPAVDKNVVNKVAFFVSDSMVKRSAKGTVWVRGLVFSTGPHTAQ